MLAHCVGLEICHIPQVAIAIRLAYMIRENDFFALGEGLRWAVAQGNGPCKLPHAEAVPLFRLMTMATHHFDL